MQKFPDIRLHGRKPLQPTNSALQRSKSESGPRRKLNPSSKLKRPISTPLQTRLLPKLDVGPRSILKPSVNAAHGDVTAGSRQVRFRQEAHCKPTVAAFVPPIRRMTEPYDAIGCGSRAHKSTKTTGRSQNSTPTLPPSFVAPHETTTPPVLPRFTHIPTQNTLPLPFKRNRTKEALRAEMHREGPWQPLSSAFPTDSLTHVVASTGCNRSSTATSTCASQRLTFQQPPSGSSGVEEPAGLFHNLISSSSTATQRALFSPDSSISAFLCGTPSEVGKPGPQRMGPSSHISSENSGNEIAVNSHSARVSRIAAGKYHSAFVSSGGRVYVCGGPSFLPDASGSSGFSSALGLGLCSGSVPLPRALGGALCGLRVMSVSAGEGHTAVITQNGCVFVCGMNDSGQLGIGSPSNCQHQATLRMVPSLEFVDIASVACGRAHTIFLPKDGKPLACGCGSYGRLGLGDPKDRCLPTPVMISFCHPTAGSCAPPPLDLGSIQTQPATDVTESSVSDCNTPVEDADSAGKGLQVIQACAGATHSLFLTSDGHVYACGNGFYGQLGTGERDDTSIPVLVYRGIYGIDSIGVDHSRPRRTQGPPAVSIACGAYHSGIVTCTGQALTFGDGRCGKLGHGCDDDELFPRCIEAFPRVGYTTCLSTDPCIVQLALGSSHSVAVTMSGQAYEWGALPTENGQTEEVHDPRLINLPLPMTKTSKPHFITEAAAGDQHTLLRGCSGQILTMGYIGPHLACQTGLRGNLRHPVMIGDWSR
eukprot:Rmarinus@m.12195